MKATVPIDALTYGSAGIGRLDNGKAVFVEGTAPGDIAQVEIVEEKRSFARAKLIALVEPSPARTDAFCPHAGYCGGCPWAHISYETQLAAKRDNLISCLTKIAHIDHADADALVDGCVASKREIGYRNKLEMAIAHDAAGTPALGFYRENTHDLFSPDTCPVACAVLEKTPKALRGALGYAQGRADLGLFRVGARGSVRTHDLEIALWTTAGPFPRSLVSRILDDALHPSSIVRIISENGKRRRIKGVEALKGKGCWEEHLAEARFRVSAPSFFQVNTAQAEKLIATVGNALKLDETETVADLYSGVGTFSIPLAKVAGHVIAVESAASAVRDLRRNAELNNVSVECRGGDSARELPLLGDVDALVVDPPRSGLAPGVPASIADARPKRVAYVSCNPSTLARDITRFAEVGYRLVHATPIDLFPQTYHVETVALLTADAK